MKFKIAQASDRIVIQINGQDVEISFFSAQAPDGSSICTISTHGRENTKYETSQSGKMEFWEFNTPGK